MLGWVIYSFVLRSTMENQQDTPFVPGTAAISDLKEFCPVVLDQVLQKNITNRIKYVIYNISYT